MVYFCLDFTWEFDFYMEVHPDGFKFGKQKRHFLYICHAIIHRESLDYLLGRISKVAFFMLLLEHDQMEILLKIW